MKLLPPKSILTESSQTVQYNYKHIHSSKCMQSRAILINNPEHGQHSQGQFPCTAGRQFKLNVMPPIKYRQIAGKCNQAVAIPTILWSSDLSLMTASSWAQLLDHMPDTRLSPHAMYDACVQAVLLHTTQCTFYTPTVPMTMRLFMKQPVQWTNGVPPTPTWIRQWLGPTSAFTAYTGINVCKGSATREAAMGLLPTTGRTNQEIILKYGSLSQFHTLDRRQ